VRSLFGEVVHPFVSFFFLPTSDPSFGALSRFPRPGSSYSRRRFFFPQLATPRSCPSLTSFAPHPFGRCPSYSWVLFLFPQEILSLFSSVLVNVRRPSFFESSPSKTPFFPLASAAPVSRVPVIRLSPGPHFGEPVSLYPPHPRPIDDSPPSRSFPSKLRPVVYCRIPLHRSSLFFFFYDAQSLSFSAF